MSKLIDVIVVGAGTSGLSASYFLRQRNVDHLVLEKSRVGETWLSQRWNSFRLNSGNIRSTLPGDTYDGPDAWGAMTHHEFVAYLQNYAVRHHLPIVPSTPVSALEAIDGVFEVTVPNQTLRARRVVVATGNLNCPVRPLWSVGLPPWVRQLDGSAYRCAEDLDEGTVLVVGSGQTGGQVAEDLAMAGRRVFLATSRTGRVVRRYRGGDMLNWLTLSGYMDVPVEDLLNAAGKPPPRALLGATHTISLQSLSARGVTLLGRCDGVDGTRLNVRDDLSANLRFADHASEAVKRHIDHYIETHGIAAPEAQDDPAELMEPNLPEPQIQSLDLREADIRTVIWCVGHVGDFSWIRIPGSLDASGQPLHEKGVSKIQGLGFVGLDFGTSRKSGTIPALAEDVAKTIADLMDAPA